MSEEATEVQDHRAAAIELLVFHFGMPLAANLLGERTCYPMDPETEWEQAKALVRDGIPKL